MEYIETQIINTCLVFLPLTLYFIFTLYRKSYYNSENNLILIITLFTIDYILIRYSLNLLFLNIPLFISFQKNLKKPAFTLSIINIIITFNVFTILEYIIIYVIYKYKKFNIFNFVIITVIFSPYIFNTITYIIAIIIVNLFFIQTEKLIKIHITNNEIINDKQVQISLFKITHEIKNPLAVIKGYLDMYDIDKQEYIDIIKEEINRTLLLLDDFSSMNKFKIVKEEIDIIYLLENLLKSYSLIFKAKHIAYEFNVKDDEIYIEGDYNRLKQVFINIIKNSMEALEKNPLIKVGTKIEDNKIKISIKDNGAGIDKNTIQKIKEPFYTTKLKGTGLGVSLSDEIIKAHNGTLKYISKEGCYTEAIVTLNIKEAT